MRVLLCGTKSDLTSKRAVSKEEGKELADSLNLPFIETSAKAGVAVDQCFEEMSKAIRKQRDASPQREQISRAGVLHAGEFGQGPVSDSGWTDCFRVFGLA